MDRNWWVGQFFMCGMELECTDVHLSYVVLTPLTIYIRMAMSYLLYFFLLSLHYEISFCRTTKAYELPRKLPLYSCMLYSIL